MSYMIVMKFDDFKLLLYLMCLFLFLWSDYYYYYKCCLIVMVLVRSKSLLNFLKKLYEL